MSLSKDHIKMHVRKYSGLCGLNLPDLGWCEIAVPENAVRNLWVPQVDGKCLNYQSFYAVIEKGSKPSG
jgi:hypothetical protein